MNLSFRQALRASLLGAALFGLTSTSSNAEPVQTGILECNVAGGVGFVLGSSKELSCVFHPARGWPEYYKGVINRIGLDIGATGAGQFVWGVFTAGQIPRHYALAGEYGGLGAGLALGPGFTANTLIGGNGNSIGLQPLSLGVETGINLSAGVGDLTLQPVPVEQPRPRRHHRRHHYS